VLVKPKYFCTSYRRTALPPYRRDEAVVVRTARPSARPPVRPVRQGGGGA